MKIRAGFVSNSSSTSHVMLWRGEKEDLSRFLRDHIGIFPTDYDGEEFTAEEIVEIILRHTDRIKSPEMIIAILQRNIQFYGECVVREKKHREELEKNETYADDLRVHLIESCDEHIVKYENRVRENQERLVLAQAAQWFLLVEFGDHDGDEEGTPIAYAMDYDGDEVVVSSESFCYFTMCNH